MQSLIAVRQIRTGELATFITGVTSGIYLPFASGEYLESLISGSDTGTAIQITGGNYLSLANLSGIGGAQVIQSGNNVLISGGAGGGTNINVTGGANLSNATLTGFAGIRVIQSGNNILFSGSSGVTNLSNVVLTTGDQNISGLKKFYNNIEVTNRLTLYSPSDTGLYTFLNADADGGISVISSAVDWLFEMPIVRIDGTIQGLDAQLYLQNNIGQKSEILFLEDGTTCTIRGSGLSLYLIPEISGCLSGNWYTNTTPTQSGNLINKGYLESGTRAYNKTSISFFPYYGNYTGTNLQEYWLSDNTILTGIRWGSNTAASGTIYYTSGTSGSPIFRPYTIDVYTTTTGNIQSTLFRATFPTGNTFSGSGLNNVLVSGGNRLGFSVISGVSGAIGVDIALFGYLQY